MPIAVLDRPGFRLKARAGMAAQRFAPYQVDESDARGLARLEPPAWTILTHRLSGLSSTALRAKKAKKKKAKGRDKTAQEKAAATLAIETSPAAILCLWGEAATDGLCPAFVRDRRAGCFPREQWQKDIHHNMRSAREGAKRGTPPNGFASFGAHPDRLLNVVLDTLDAAKAEQVAIIDLRGKTSIGDQMVVASGARNGMSGPSPTTSPKS